jgi:hypothetical protein
MRAAAASLSERHIGFITTFQLDTALRLLHPLILYWKPLGKLFFSEWKARVAFTRASAPCTALLSSPALAASILVLLSRLVSEIPVE